MSPKQVKAIRKRLGMSQEAFARLICTSTAAVQKWEIGEREPSLPSLEKLIAIDRSSRHTPQSASSCPSPSQDKGSERTDSESGVQSTESQGQGPRLGEAQQQAPETQ